MRFFRLIQFIKLIQALQDTENGLRKYANDEEDVSCENCKIDQNGTAKNIQLFYLTTLFRWLQENAGFSDQEGNCLMRIQDP